MKSNTKTPRRGRLVWMAAIFACVSLFGLVALASGDPVSMAMTALAGGLGLIGFKNFWEFQEDFDGHLVFSTTKGSYVGHRFTVTQTGSGSPTIAVVDGAAGPGELQVQMSADEEIQIITIDFGDQLCYDIDKISEVGFRIKGNQSAWDAATQFACGLTGDRNDDIDSIAQAALFRVIGGDSTTAVVVESDDGTNDNDDKSTGQTLVDDYKWFVISFTKGTNDVRFFIGGQPVGTATQFDMSNYTGALQLFMQLQKTADTNTDGFVCDAIYVRGRR